MSDRAAISAQLVDVRNVGTHKAIKLTVHVPAEQADLVMRAFGWPTMVDPVPVALARIHAETREVAQKPPPRSPDKVPEAGARNPLSMRAGMLCEDELFHRYLEWLLDREEVDEEFATHYLREWCRVESRSQIIPGTEAAQTFSDLLDEFYRWRDEPKFADA